MTPRGRMIESVDVALLTALPLELDAALAVLGSWWELPGDEDTGRTYYGCETASGLRVVAACGRMGQLRAALLAKDVVARFQPAKIILVGIAARLDPHLKLGDVVVSDQIVDYELAKVTDSGPNIRWSVYRSDFRLADGLAGHSHSWWEQIGVPRPDADGVKPSVFKGDILSGNKVIASEDEAGKLKAAWVKAAALEMEAAGVAAALETLVRPPSFVMVKGISDSADRHKDDRWQEYAARAAATLTADYLLSSATPAVIRQPFPRSRSSDSRPAEDRVRLLDTMRVGYSLGELREVAFRLGLHWDDFAGETRSERVIALIEWAERKRRYDQLREIVLSELADLFAAHADGPSDSGAQ